MPAAAPAAATPQQRSAPTDADAGGHFYDPPVPLPEDPDPADSADDLDAMLARLGPAPAWSVQARLRAVLKDAYQAAAWQARRWRGQ